MANTFPSSGNAGIGTTSPENLLTLDTGTGNSTPAIQRIKGRSPALLFGSPALGYCGGEAFVGLITAANDYVTGGDVGDTFFIHASNANRAFLGRTTGNAPVMTVHNTLSNVAVRWRRIRPVICLDFISGAQGEHRPARCAGS